MTLDIRKYNGGLFADDPVLDGLKIPDEVFGLFRDLAEYDFRPPSAVADAEVVSRLPADRRRDPRPHLRAVDRRPGEAPGRAGQAGRDPGRTRGRARAKAKVSRRKREGAFYTPAYITRYIVEQALGRRAPRPVRERSAREHAEKAKAAARASWPIPRPTTSIRSRPPQREALLAFWLDWQHELGSIRILDPACGSGAFLIEAFDQLHAEYEQTNDRVRELRGFAELFDLDRKILQENLYGVDLNEEAVHIAKLSLWIKTAVKGKELTSLDHNLRVGNSIVADPADRPAGVRLAGRIPGGLRPSEAGGFDVVIGNPPYIRQEWLSPIKPYLQSRYAAYHGMADLYVYFYELGLSLLRPGGRLSYVVTNKWMKAGYGEPLRRFFAEKGWVESVVDFGHAKQIFEDADVFPSIIVVRRPDEGRVPETTRVCAIPREQLRIDDLSVQIAKEGIGVERSRLGANSWQLEPRGVFGFAGQDLGEGYPLGRVCGAKPYYGIKTGFNEAFLIDSRTRGDIDRSRFAMLGDHQAVLARPGHQEVVSRTGQVSG